MELIGMNITKLEEITASVGIPRFRAKQIFEWINKGVFSIDDMTNISKEHRELLKSVASVTQAHVVSEKRSKLDGTGKFLFELGEGVLAEGVFMEYSYGNSVCISTQAGCKMGCIFCASTGIPFTRNLTAGEMAFEVLAMEKARGKRVGHVVLMGVGEPLDNMDNVVDFLHYINDPRGLNIGMRNISLSTCGLVPKIQQLAQLQLQITLSVSLHAPDDETRSRIMPVNRRYPIKELMAACDDYFKKTGRRISYEYSMIDGVNDTVRHEEMLGRLLHGKNCHVNLICLNEVKGSPLHPSKRVNEFAEGLKKWGVNATVRRRLGADIDGACGQLRSIFSGDRQ